MRRLLAAVALIIIVFGATTMTTAAVPEQRVALVIGNSSYKNAPLKNPANDAHLMAETLRGLGFQVIERTDVSQRGMRRLIRDFGEALDDAGPESVGLFYYAGHGVQARGENYLIPVDAVINRESDLKIEGVSANEVLNTLSYADNRLNIVILDACRDNPYSRSFRSAAQGLARMDAPRGTLVAYATAPGGLSADGKGDNSPYTLALSEVMKIPDIVAEQMFKQVRVEVMAQTKGKQVPWEESSLTGDFYFSSSEDTTASEAQAPEPSVIRADTSAMDLAFWQSIQNSTDPAMFEAYLQSYPEGTFANIARLKRDALSEAPEQETQIAAVVPPPEASIAVEEMDATFVARRTSNVRAEPTIGSDHIGRLARDDAVIVTGKVTDKNWYRIAYQGETAFVFGTLIEEIDPGEIVAWETIASTSAPADLEEFLSDFPNGYFSARARSRLTAMDEARRREAERIAAEETARKAAERRAATEDARLKAAASEEARRKAAVEEAERRATELAFWESVKNSDNPADYQAYLEAYPNGQFAALARVRAARKPPPTEVAALTAPAQPTSVQPSVPLAPGAGLFDGDWILEIMDPEVMPNGDRVRTKIVDNKFSISFSANGWHGTVSGKIDKSGELVAQGSAKKLTVDRRSKILKFSSEYVDGSFYAVNKHFDHFAKKLFTFTLTRASPVSSVDQD